MSDQEQQADLLKQLIAAAPGIENGNVSQHCRPRAAVSIRLLPSTANMSISRWHFVSFLSFSKINIPRHTLINYGLSGVHCLVPMGLGNLD